MNILAGHRFHVAITAIAALWIAAPLPAAVAPGCDALCAQWQLEDGSTGDINATIDAAMAKYKEPKPRHRRQPPPTLEGMAQAEMERAIGPITDRPERDELRAELQRLLDFPPRLAISVEGRDVLIAAPPGVPRRYSPGEPHARVDAWGTARISCVLRDGRITVNQRYERSRQFTQTYSVQRDGRLLVTYEIRRPGLEKLRVTASYQVAPAPLSH